MGGHQRAVGAAETQGLLGVRQSPDQGRQQRTSRPHILAGEAERSKTMAYSAGCGQASGGRTNQDPGSSAEEG